MLLSLQQAISALTETQVIAVPTETFYGLAADLRDNDAVAAIFAIKQRQPTSPSPVLVPSIEAAQRLLTTEIPPLAHAMMQQFWPGRLTLILPNARPDLSRYVRQKDTIALRHDGHPELSKLLSKTGHPVTGTSANLSGQPAMTTGTQVSALFGHHPNYAGHIGEVPTTGGAPSTILDLSTETPRVLREGALPSADVMQALHAFNTHL